MAVSAAPPEGCGVVFACRDDKKDGSSLGIDVGVAGLGSTQQRGLQFGKLVLPAGEHTITAGPKGTFAAAQFTEARYPLTVAEGDRMVVLVTMHRGLTKNPLEIKQTDMPALDRCAYVR